MKLLLDTHIVLWMLRDARELGAQARKLIGAADELYVSSVSIWEAAIKAAAGKLPIDMPRMEAQLLATGCLPLPMTWAHAVAYRQLPPLHRDPFDRMLVSQAMSEPLRFLTHDAALAAYSDLVTVV
ncbi:MAG: type II toxin-antitoxin system VapC family toxin [Methylibium sp.]|uniref:type II toxin-antitoxin system VapC family toxin n=1 Tax=Methylibium sp. TaxID=2067992 RepID=UPI0018324278|nr:type II toxin-antitoxin system VapC family toxin [Methylibium sp.]MBA3597398.1 type II toxin-antitoxin system VapC family toxin [Methylibium sp.]